MQRIWRLRIRRCAVSLCFFWSQHYVWEEIRETNESSRQLTASIEFLVEDNERIECENKSLLSTVQELRQKEMVKLLEKIKVLEKENEDLKADKYDTADYVLFFQKKSSNFACLLLFLRSMNCL